MKQLLIKFWCWLRCHDFKWERNHWINKPNVLVCLRCGHREENGLAWCLKQIAG